MTFPFSGFPGSGWLTQRLKLDGGGVQTSQPVLSLKQTWANPTQAFTGVRLDITNNASSALSTVFRLNVNNSPSVWVGSDGSICTQTSVQVGGVGNNSVGGMANGGDRLYFFSSANSFLNNGDNNYASKVSAAVDDSGFVVNRASAYNWAQNISSSLDVSLYSDGAGILNQRVGTSGQIARWSRTHTDSSNYERVELDVSTNTFRFGPRAAGTGTARVLYLETGSTTVANLASAATVGAGARAFVTDATATTFLSVVAGGGSNKVPVVSDGTNWLIG